MTQHGRHPVVEAHAQGEQQEGAEHDEVDGREHPANLEPTKVEPTLIDLLQEIDQAIRQRCWLMMTINCDEL